MSGLCVGAVFMPNKIWMRRVGFVWGHQWLTLCSICFFAGTKCLLRWLGRRSLKYIEILKEIGEFENWLQIIANKSKTVVYAAMSTE